MYPVEPNYPLQHNNLVSYMTNTWILTLYLNENNMKKEPRTLKDIFVYQITCQNVLFFLIGSNH